MKTNRTYEQLEMEFAQCAHGIKASENQLKAMERQARDLTRRQRTKRLCTRGGMLEHFLDRPELLSDDQVMELLTIAFREAAVNAALNAMLAETTEQSLEQWKNLRADPRRHPTLASGKGRNYT